MKKFIYFCGMMLLSLNMTAQFDPYDQNWKPKLIEDFTTPGRYWIDSSFLSSDSVWKAYSSGLTHGNNKMIYQYSQCHFNDTDGYMELVAEYDSSGRIPAHVYKLPYNVHNYPSDTNLHYFSGRIDHYDRHGADSAKYRYGYFEIRCKLPIHRGAFPAFWLWYADSISPTNQYYEEIDIFEFSWEFEDDSASWQPNPHPHGAGNPFCFTSGLYYNRHDASYEPIDSTSQARVYPMINDSLSHWHTFSCEWIPEHILWYCDGILVDEYYNTDSIPQHPLALKTNYGIDRYALKGYKHYGEAEWKSQDTMFIDYIKVYQLAWNCGTDEIITRQSELDDFDFTVKKSISITSTIEPVSIGSNKKVTFRATDSFEITGPFQVDSGGKFTVIMQSCPE
jgi:beta-glucanase (GH16 family)